MDKKIGLGGKLVLIGLVVLLLGFLRWSFWWNLRYCNFETYCNKDDYVAVLFSTADKSVKTIVTELYESGIYPSDMPYEALADEVAKLNRVASDSFTKPDYIIVPFPKEKLLSN